MPTGQYPWSSQHRAPASPASGACVHRRTASNHTQNQQQCAMAHTIHRLQTRARWPRLRSASSAALFGWRGRQLSLTCHPAWPNQPRGLADTKTRYGGATTQQSWHNAHGAPHQAPSDPFLRQQNTRRESLQAKFDIQTAVETAKSSTANPADCQHEHNSLHTAPNGSLCSMLTDRNSTA